MHTESRSPRIYIFDRALDTLQLVLIGHVLYYWVITNYDNPKVLAVSVW
jgi:hypothetical protein